MHKTLEDYRNIVKILKLELLKLRVENQEIAKKLGEVDPHAKSTYSDKIDSYKKQQSTIASNSLIFLELADKCELLGVTPQMIFRISDDKRQKKIKIETFRETLKRLALRLDQSTIVRLCTFFNINKDGTIRYDDFMETISAYQIQTQKYPLEGKSFAQSSLSKFSEETREQSIDGIFNEISKKNKTFTFQQFLSYGKKNLPRMSQNQLTAVFMSLNNDESCQIKKNSFVNEISRIQMTSQSRAPSVVNRNNNYKQRDEQQNIFERKESQKNRSNTNQKKKSIEQKKKTQQMTYQPKGSKKYNESQKQQNQKKKVSSPKALPKKYEDDFDEQQNTATEAKKKQEVKNIPKQVSKCIDILRSSGLTVDGLFNKLLDEAQEKKEMKSISSNYFFQCAQNISKKAQRSKMLNVFKTIDDQKKGSLSSENLLKFWIQARDRNDGMNVLLKILKREIKMRKSDDATQFFTSRNIKLDTTYNNTQFKKTFPDFNLENSELSELGSLLGSFKASELAKKINSIGKYEKEGPSQDFKKIDSSTVNVFNKLVNPLLPKNVDEGRFEKNNRGLKKVEFWNTIFTNQWVCWNYCLKTIKQLTSPWKDPEFGPVDGDQNGFNSIVANENERPDWRLPPSEYTWIDHRQLLKQNESQDKVEFINKDVSTKDVVQGQIGNCWFISALSIVAQYPSLLKGQQLKNINKTNIEDCLKGVIPSLFAGFRKYGMYVFKFFKDGKPIFVVVDNKLPSQMQSAELLFAKTPLNRMGVQWVSLVEKAYAKLHNTYSALFSGDIAEGLRDLTNALAVRQIISKKEEERAQLWSRLQQFKIKKTLMGCSISTPKDCKVEGAALLDGERTGLLYGHAYSISDAFRIQNPKPHDDSQKIFDLMRVRNPHGSGQYQLDWSQKDKNRQEYDPEQDKLTKYWELINNYYKKQEKRAKQKRQQGVEGYTEADDGIFLMSFHDWSEIYSTIFLGLSLNEEWGCQYFLDSWSQKFPGQTVSLSKATDSEKKQFCLKNLQYRIQLKKETQLLCILQQKDGRLYRGEVYPFKGIWNSVVLMLFKINEKDSKLSGFEKSDILTNSLTLQARREVSLMRRLGKGTYIVMPVLKGLSDFKDRFLNFEFQVHHKCGGSDIKVSSVHSGLGFKEKNMRRMSLSQGSNPNDALSLIQQISRTDI